MFFEGKSPNVLSYTVYMYGSGQPYTYASHLSIPVFTMQCQKFILHSCVYEAMSSNHITFLCSCGNVIKSYYIPVFMRQCQRESFSIPVFMRQCQRESFSISVFTRQCQRESFCVLCSWGNVFMRQCQRVICPPLIVWVLARSPLPFLCMKNEIYYL